MTTRPNVREALEKITAIFAAAPWLHTEGKAVHMPVAGMPDGHQLTWPELSALAAALSLPPAGAEIGEETRYIPDLVKNAMLVAWREICADTGCHPLDIEHGKNKYLTFEPRHWAQMAGNIVATQIARLSRPVVGWQPIETAPKLEGDDHELLGIWLDDRGEQVQVFIHYDASNADYNHGFIGRFGECYGAGGITHWRYKDPPPALPTASPDKAEG